MNTAAAIEYTAEPEPDAFQQLSASGRRFRVLLHKGVYVGQLFSPDGSVDIETECAHRNAADAYEELNSKRLLFAEADRYARTEAYLEALFHKAGL